MLGKLLRQVAVPKFTSISPLNLLRLHLTSPIFAISFRPDLNLTHSFWSLLIGSTIYFFSACNNQSVLQRSCAQHSLPKAMLYETISIISLPILTIIFYSSLILSGPLVILLVILLWLTTLVAFAYFSSVEKCDPFISKVITSPNQIMSHFVMVVMRTPGFPGLYFAGLFSGALR